MKKIKGLSLADKVALFFILVTFFSGMGIYFAVKQVREKELITNARRFSTFLETILATSERWHGLWVKRPEGLKVVSQVSGLSLETNDEVELFRLHDPEALKYLASQASAENFKLILDLHNPVLYREKWQFEKHQFIYQRPLVVKKGCVSCHEVQKGAPPLRLGETIGAIKVFVHYQSLWSLLGESVFLGVAAVFFLVTVVLYGLVRFELLSPLANLTQKVREMSLGNLDVDLGVRNLSEDQTKDEILKLAISIERLRKSQKTMEKMLDDDSLVL